MTRSLVAASAAPASDASADVVVWALLNNAFSAGTLAFGLILGIVIPILTSAYWPDRPVMSKP